MKYEEIKIHPVPDDGGYFATYGKTDMPLCIPNEYRKTKEDLIEYLRVHIGYEPGIF